METVTRRAIHGFVHGALNLAAGQSAQMSKTVADDLAAAGLVEGEDSPAGAASDAQAKAAPPHENKMAPPLTNKVLLTSPVGTAQEPKRAK